MGCNRGVSEPVGEELRTYTARVAAIREILSEHLTVDGLVQNNRVANPIRPVDCLSASWGADVAPAPILTVSIHPVEDFAAEVEELRYGADSARGAYEAHRAEPDEFALVQVQLSSVWVVVGHCEVYLAARDISPRSWSIPLSPSPAGSAVRPTSTTINHHHRRPNRRHPES